jgi:HK97 family phage major capsid protein
MSANILEGAIDLEKKIEQLGNSLAKGFESIHKSQETNSIGYFENQDEDEQVVAIGRGQSVKVKKFKKVSQIPGYKKQFKSFTDFIHTGFRKESEFESKHKAATDMLLKASALTTLDSEGGGALVLPEFAPDIASIFYSNDILSRTRQFTIGGNRMEFPKMQEASRANGTRSGGILGYWLDEGDLATGSKPAFQGTELKLKKLCVVVYLTDELIDDNSYALEQWVREAVQREIAFMVGDALFNGPGGQRPLGILSAPSLVSVTKESGQAAGTIKAENVMKMYSRRRLGQNVGDYAWFVNQDTEPQLFGMTLGTSGSQQVVYLPPGGLSGSMYGSLYGLPVIPTEFNSTCGTAGDIVLANFKNYYTINKGGVQEAASTHVEFLRGQTALKFTIRIDGRPIFDTATTPFKGTNTQSDFIALETRA